MTLGAGWIWEGGVNAGWVGLMVLVPAASMPWEGAAWARKKRSIAISDKRYTDLLVNIVTLLEVSIMM
jgi:hypothetical protein